MGKRRHAAIVSHFRARFARLARNLLTVSVQPFLMPTWPRWRTHRGLFSAGEPQPAHLACGRLWRGGRDEMNSLGGAIWHDTCFVMGCNPSLCQLGPGTFSQERVPGPLYSRKIRTLWRVRRQLYTIRPQGRVARCDTPASRNAISAPRKPMNFLWFLVGAGVQGAWRRSGGLMRPAQRPRRARRASSWSTRYRSTPCAASAHPLRTIASLTSRSPT